MAIKPPSDRLDSVFCSKDCQVKSKVQSQNLLFGLDSPLPRELAPDMSPDATKQRDTAQAAFVDHIKKNGKNAVLLVARFIARQVAAETAKMLPISSTPPPPSDAPEADGGEYTLYDHIERLRYLQVVAPEEEVKLLAKVLATAVPGLDQFVTDERHATLLGKMAYNAYGVCFGGGRDDKACLPFFMYSIRPSFLPPFDSLPRQNDPRMSRRHEHLTGLQSKLAVAST